MAASEKRKKQMAAARARKAATFRAALASGDTAGKSKFQQKVQRKLGSGRIEPGWMWWSERHGS